MTIIHVERLRSTGRTRRPLRRRRRRCDVSLLFVARQCFNFSFLSFKLTKNNNFVLYEKFTRRKICSILASQMLTSLLWDEMRVVLTPGKHQKATALKIAIYNRNGEPFTFFQYVDGVHGHYEMIVSKLTVKFICPLEHIEKIVVTYV